MNRLKLIIIDDDKVSLMIVEKQFKSFGFETIIFDNCFDALDCVKKYHDFIDLIVCDVNLPDFSGSEFVHEIKNIKVLSNIPIIMLSSDNDIQLAIKFVNDGCKDYIIKPITNEKVSTILKNLKLHNYDSNLETITQVDDKYSILTIPGDEWDEASEDLLRDWMLMCNKESVKHKKKGDEFRTKHKIGGFANILTSSLIFLFSGIRLNDSDSLNTTVVTVFSFFGLITVNVNAFLNLGPKYQKHYEFEGRYSKVSINLKEILSNNVKIRVRKVRVLAEYKEIVGNLTTNAPDV